MIYFDLFKLVYDDKIIFKKNVIWKDKNKDMIILSSKIFY